MVGTDVLLHTEGGDAAFIAGVNVGPTIPGYQPGEVAIRREDFRRWFPLMAEQGYRALRIYSIQPPSFYEELLAYNLTHPDEPLYLIHGAWIPEERFISERDLFAPGLQQEFFDEISNAISVVFGDAVLPDRLGHAEGTYTADVSPWTYAWILGVEWDPAATVDNNMANAGMAPSAGRYFDATPNASPTEIWIAGAVDHAASELSDRGASVPIAFANWPTTDPLTHPDEPLPEEDLVGVDANHVVPTNWPAGTFASYHAYPYYPDFQRYESGIADCNFRGRPDNYAGYLSKLRQHHEDMPVMITEFGVPSAWAHAHFGPQGRNQGGHSEEEAMLINAEMMATISELGFSGGYVFQWTDEWFKFTWNTIDYELPTNRRQLWMNAWTNEAHFGVVAVEPGDAMTVTIDGDRSEWETNGSQVIQEGAGSIREVRALKDEGFLYLGITLADDDVLDSSGLTIGFDVLPGRSGGVVGTDGLAPGSDYAATIDTPAGEDGDGQVWVAGHADVYRKTYGVLRGYVDVDPEDLEEGSMAWAPHRLITNRPLVIPTTGESFGVELVNAGLLRQGTSDPTDASFDSRAAWNRNGEFLEIRIPFFAIGIAGLMIISALREQDREWALQSWDFAKQILPLLLAGVFIAGFALGRPGHEGIIPSEWVAIAVGDNTLTSTVIASVLGALMYFSTLTEVPIVQALIGSGMGKGPALALLLAGPALSLPNMLVIRTILGTQKTLVYCALVVVMATITGFVYGNWW